MAELKTKPTNKSVQGFLDAVENEKKRQDAYTILEMMKDITQKEPVIWGDSIIGFGDYHYKYASGREGDWFKIGFSPRTRNLTLYFVCGLDNNQDLLAKLGKYRTGVGCLYINKLDDVDLDVLHTLVERSFTSKS